MGTVAEFRKKTMFHILIPSGPKQMLEFLGIAGFCHLWIPELAELAVPIYLLTKSNGPFKWEKRNRRHLTASSGPYCLPLHWGFPMSPGPFGYMWLRVEE